MLDTAHARFNIIRLNSADIIRKLHKLLQISLRSILFHKAANVSRKKKTINKKLHFNNKAPLPFSWAVDEQH